MMDHPLKTNQTPPFLPLRPLRRGEAGPQGQPTPTTLAAFLREQGGEQAVTEYIETIVAAKAERLRTSGYSECEFAVRMKAFRSRFLTLFYEGAGRE